MKNKKNYAVILVFACLTLVAGLVFLFSSLGIAFESAIAKWYLVLLMYLAGGTLAVAIIKNAPLYYTISSLFVGIFLSLSFDRPFAEFWALIPICVAIGMIVTHLVSHGRFKYMKFALPLLVLSIILLTGGILHKWAIVVPVVLILIGVATIVYAIIRIAAPSKISDEEDYHVRPSKETKINEKEDLE